MDSYIFVVQYGFSTGLLRFYMGTTVSVPGRVICAGDYAQPTARSHPTVSCAIDTRLRVRITPRSDQYLAIRSSEVHQKVLLEEIFTDHSDSTFALNNEDRRVEITQLIKKVFEKIVDVIPESGFTLTVDADPEFTLGSGLGSSTALLVALTASIAEHFDRRQPPSSIATQAAAIESDLYDDARTSDAHSIARGGFIHDSGTIEREQFDQSLIIGRKRTELDYTTSLEQAKNYGNRSQTVQDSIENFALKSTEEVWKAILDKDEHLLRQSLVAAGDSLEAMGLSNAPLRSARATAITHTDQIGIKQSGIGHRSVLIGVSPDDSAPFRQATRSIGGEMFDTSVANEGIRYGEEIGSTPSISTMKRMGELVTRMRSTTA